MPAFAGVTVVEKRIKRMKRRKSLVEPRGIEPLTSALRTRRSPS
jgi:hypothetical protein